jgi:hypothetical protein
MLSHLILREKRNSGGLAGERSFHSRGGGLGGNPTAGLPAAPANSSPPFLKERAVKPGGLDPSAAMLARARPAFLALFTGCTQRPTALVWAMRDLI